MTVAGLVDGAWAIALLGRGVSCPGALAGNPSRLGRGVASLLPITFAGDCGIGVRSCSLRFAVLVMPESDGIGVELPGDRMADGASESERMCAVVPAGVKPQ